MYLYLSKTNRGIKLSYYSTRMNSDNACKSCVYDVDSCKSSSVHIESIYAMGPLVGCEYWRLNVSTYN